MPAGRGPSLGGSHVAARGRFSRGLRRPWRPHPAGSGPDAEGRTIPPPAGRRPSARAEDRPGATAWPAGDHARSHPITGSIDRLPSLGSLLFLAYNYTAVFPFCQGFGVLVVA